MSAVEGWICCPAENVGKERKVCRISVAGTSTKRRLDRTSFTELVRNFVGKEVLSGHRRRSSSKSSSSQESGSRSRIVVVVAVGTRVVVGANGSGGCTHVRRNRSNP